MRKLFIVFSIIAVFGFWACGGGEDKKAPEDQMQDTYEQEDAGETIEQGDTSMTDDEMDEMEEEADKTAKAAPSKTDYTSDPLTGKVIDFEDFATGGTGDVSRNKAKNIASNDGILAIKSGNRIFFVYHESGTIANDKLANYAGLSKVGLWGTVKSSSGQNAFIMTKITSLE